MASKKDRQRAKKAGGSYRDSVSGEYVSPEYAKANPGTTVFEAETPERAESGGAFLPGAAWRPNERENNAMQRIQGHVSLMTGRDNVVVGVSPELPHVVVYLDEAEIRRLSETNMGDDLTAEEVAGEWSAIIS